MHRRFRQRVSSRPWRWPYWEDDPAFSVDDHVRVVGERTTYAGLRDHVDVMMRGDMDLSRPPWEVVLFPDYEGEEEEQKSAVVIRLHHVLGDGVSLVRPRVPARGRACGCARD